MKEAVYQLPATNAVPQSRALEKVFAIVRLLRVHQWVKNLLVLVPVVASHRFLEVGVVLASAKACAAFCCMASCIYVINDLCDVRADRNHAVKKYRPFASGALPTSWGPPLAVLLGITATAVALRLSPAFLLVLGMYAAFSISYSLGFKRVALLDVFVLAGLYLMRLVAGQAATGIILSPWLLGFGMFLFLCLAFLKRYTELLTLLGGSRVVAEGRGYTVQDLETMRLFGVISGYMSALVFALYINSDVVRINYRAPAFLWGIAPLLLLWVSRLWMVAQRGRMAADPVVFALRDGVSYAVAGCGMTLFWLATVNPASGVAHMVQQVGR